MTRDDIIRMALEVGYRADVPRQRPGSYRLARFAALVAAAEREACAALCEARYMGDLTR